MEIIYLDGQQLNMPASICSAIGFFDGLHLGHMALVDEVKRVSKQMGYKSALMTFDHHPLFVLGRITQEKYISSMEDRIEILNKEGIDYLFVIRFTKEVAALSPDAFIENYLVNLNIRHVVCGFDFRFGSRNSGSGETLIKYNPDILKVSIIDEVIFENEKISSTRIRNCLDEGHVEELNSLLNRHYAINGHVIGGKKIGREMGFPTANIDYGSYYLPQNGVYAVKVYLDDKEYLGMCNIGYNPTFHLIDKRSLEVHIFDFDENIYDKHVSVEFYKKTRNEKKFSNKDELMNQLSSDKTTILEYFSKTR